MSIIFGVTKPAGQTAERRELLDLGRLTEKFAPDGTFVHAQGRVGMGFQPYHTHKRSNLETLPLIDAHSNVLSFDGRLDNHAELCDLLEVREAEISDSRIVLRAFKYWGEDCFSKLIGEWALALWAESEKALYLARDHAGTRSLYYEGSNGQILWSTYLETFFGSGQLSDLDEDFAALYLACQPTRELTPYKGIRAVPPSRYLRFCNGAVGSRPHWNCILKGSIVYNSNVEYEDHFLQLFRQSVQRRTGPGAQILAELSGGMDSTSIVCMSDHIRRSHKPTLDLLETISYYDDSEPNWDEFPYFTAVETSRGRSGLHLDSSYGDMSIRLERATASRRLWPGADGSSSHLEARLHAALKGLKFRTVISGLGGDEVLGGVPTPLPELADLLTRGSLRALLNSSVEWCLANRVPLLYLLVDTVVFTSRLYATGLSRPQTVPPWICRQLGHQGTGWAAEENFWARLQCQLPSRLDNCNVWWSLLETLPTRLLSNEERFEFRYPYLDRDLVEFLCRIPTRQLVEPGRRRSLMRRALQNIVPDLILERRRKAYLIRGPINLIRRDRDWLAAQFANLRCVEMGLVDPSSLPSALDSVATNGDPKWWPYLMRLISFELWLGSAPLHIPPPIPNVVAKEIRVRLSSTGLHDSEI